MERMQEKRNFESLQRETVLKEALIEKARVQDELRTMKARTHLWGSQRDGMKRLACKCLARFFHLLPKVRRRRKKLSDLDCLPH